MQKEIRRLAQSIKGQPVTSPPTRYTSPLRLLALVSVSVFAAETTVMLLFTILPPLPPLWLVFLDAFLLVVLAFPALYLYLLRPLALQIDERQRAEAALRQAHDELKNRLDELRKSEAKLRIIVDNSVDGITLVDETGLVLEWNRGQEQITGIAREEALGQTIWDVQSRLGLETQRTLERRQQVAEYGRQFLATGQLPASEYALERPILRPDGTLRVVQSLPSPIKTDRGHMIVSITRDVTDRKRAEEQIQVQIAAMEAVADGIVITDRQGSIQWTNPALTQISGYAAREVVGQSTRIFKSGQHDAGYYGQMWTTILSGQVWRGELVNRRKDGSLYAEEQTISPVKNARGELTHFVAIKQDITHRKQAEEALKASETRFRTVANFTYDWEYWLAPDAKIIYMSPSCERVTGYRLEDFLNDPDLLERVIHPDDRAPMADHTHQALAHDEIMPIDFRLVRRDGAVRWIGHVCRLVYDENGRALGRRVSNRDITERKQAENALREQEKLYRSIFETATDSLVISTLDGVIVEVNGAFCEMHACARGEVIGRRITSFIHPTHRHRFTECVQAIRAGAAFEAQAVSLRADDRPFYVEMHGIGLSYYGEPHILTVIRDVSQQVEAYMQLEQRVQERTHELRMLLEFSQSMTRTLEMRPLLSLILEQLHSVVDYSSATILTLSGKELAYAAHKGPLAEPETRRLHFSSESPLGRAVIGQTRPVIIPDVQANTSLAIAFQKTLGDLVHVTFKDARSWMGIPLIITDHMVGMLAVAHRQAYFYTQRHADLASGFASHAALAIENAQLYEQARDLAAIQERQRLARDLHDSVSQTLFSASLAAQVLPRLWDRHPAEGQQCLDELSRLTRGALAEMRALLIELRPHVLVETKLGDLLRQLAEAITSRTRVPVQVTTDELAPLPADAQIALYRIAQESLNNIAKHAGASQAIVQLQRTMLDNNSEYGVELTISDDGRGFSQTGISADHLGLGIMRERAEAINAALHIDSEIGRGTRIVVHWPKPNRSLA
jgi:two-component system nitrate/nitrite sensor histidine kinase NarX